MSELLANTVPGLRALRSMDYCSPAECDQGHWQLIDGGWWKVKVADFRQRRGLSLYSVGSGRSDEKRRREWERLQCAHHASLWTKKVSITRVGRPFLMPRDWPDPDNPDQASGLGEKIFALSVFIVVGWGAFSMIKYWAAVLIRNF